MFLSYNAFCVALWQAERTDVKANGQKKIDEEREVDWILKWLLAEEVSTLLQPHLIGLLILVTVLWLSRPERRVWRGRVSIGTDRQTEGRAEQTDRYGVSQATSVFPD